jgi:hypothetical protein
MTLVSTKIGHLNSLVITQTLSWTFPWTFVQTLLARFSLPDTLL